MDTHQRHDRSRCSPSRQPDLQQSKHIHVLATRWKHKARQMNNHPQFSQERHAIHDLAKHIIIDEFHANGWQNVHVNPDTFGADLIATSGKNGRTWTIEVEVKNNWDTGAFKYRTLHISARKMKWHSPYHIHVTINRDWTHYLIVPPSALLEAKIVAKSTIYSEKELFLEIPTTETQIIQRKNK